MEPDIFSSLLWSAAGFVLGWLTCRAVMRSSVSKPRRAQSMKSADWEVIRTAIGVLILVLISLAGVRYYQTTSCQTEYNRVVASALAQRSEAQRLENEGQINLLTASLSEDYNERQRATLLYIEAIRELERVRAASPVPPPPNCGEFR